MCSVAAFLSIWLKIRTLNLMLWDVRIYGVEYGWDRKSSDKICRLKENGLPQNQDDIAEMIGISVDTFQNYKNLQKWFQSWQNDPAKDRKALATYVELKGYEHGGNRNSSVQSGHLNLDEIAKELNMSTGNLRRILRIERNLTDSMKELLDTGEITKTFASDTIASLSEN